MSKVTCLECGAICPLGAAKCHNCSNILVNYIQSASSGTDTQDLEAYEKMREESNIYKRSKGGTE